MKYVISTICCFLVTYCMIAFVRLDPGWAFNVDGDFRSAFIVGSCVLSMVVALKVSDDEDE